MESIFQDASNIFNATKFIKCILGINTWNSGSDKRKFGIKINLLSPSVGDSANIFY